MFQLLNVKEFCNIAPRLQGVFTSSSRNPFNPHMSQSTYTFELNCAYNLCLRIWDSRLCSPPEIFLRTPMSIKHNWQWCLNRRTYSLKWNPNHNGSHRFRTSVYYQKLISTIWELKGFNHSTTVSKIFTSFRKSVSC